MKLSKRINPTGWERREERTWKLADLTIEAPFQQEHGTNTWFVFHSKMWYESLKVILDLFLCPRPCPSIEKISLHKIFTWTWRRKLCPWAGHTGNQSVTTQFSSAAALPASWSRQLRQGSKDLHPPSFRGVSSCFTC